MNTMPEGSFLKGTQRDVNDIKLNNIVESICTGEANNDIAIIDTVNGETKRISFLELAKLSDKLAKNIQLVHSEQNFTGTELNNIVAVKMQPTYELIVVLLAIWKSGKAYLPLDHEFPDSMVNYILKDAKPLLLIYDQMSPGNNDDITAMSVEELHNFKQTTYDKKCELHTQEDDIAVVMYTSGSTGEPKGVRLTHKSIWNRLQWQYNVFPYSNTEKICVFKTALVFGDSIAEIWAPLLCSRTLLVVSKGISKDPEIFLEILNNYKIERIVLVPSLLESILIYLESQMQKKYLENLKLWVTSGEVLETALAERFYKCFSGTNKNLCNVYGSTELTADATYYIINRIEDIKCHKKVPIGTPIDNTIVYLLNPNLQPTAKGEIGEMFVSGCILTDGFMNDANSERIIENPFTTDRCHNQLFRTGDLARLENNILVFEGRTDSQIKIRGRKINLTGIEQTIKAMEGIEKVVVLCHKSGSMSQNLVAFVTTKYPMDGFRIESKLKKLLVWYMVPQIIVLNDLPLLVSGKIDKQALLGTFDELLIKGAHLNYEGVDDGNMETAKVLFETVATVLNNRARADISLKSNFYEIGGNSLNTVSTITILRDHGYDISIENFITSKNFEEVLTRMTSKINSSQEFKYIVEPLKEEHKDDVAKISFSSIYHKSDLEQYFVEDLTEDHYKELIDAFWNPSLEANLSFVVKSLKNDIVGIVINFDARIPPRIDVHSKMSVKFEFLETLEKPFRDNVLPPEIGSVLEVLFISTHSSITPEENVALLYFMEKEVLKFAKEKKFKGVFGTNVSKITQQLAHDYLNYEVLLDYQVNQFVAHDGSRPFSLAPDDQRAMVVYKQIV